MKGFGDLYKSEKKANKKSAFSKKQIINQAIKLHKEGNISEATKYYQKIIKQGYDEPTVFSNYGVILKSLGKLKEAEISTRKSIELNPNYAIAHCNLGGILKDIGKLKEAEISTRKSIELNPNYAIAHCNLGGILKDIGKLKEAEISTRKALELNPNSFEAHCNLGNILKDIGKLKEAEISTRKALELNPNCIEAHCNLGNILKDLGKLKEAEISTRTALELNPNYASAYSNLGSILKDIGKLKEAEISTRKALELYPNCIEAHCNLGNILRDRGKLKEAEISTRKALEINPDFDTAHSNLGNILLDFGKLNELLILSKATLKSKSINQGFKSLASLRITITNLLKKDFSNTLFYLQKTHDLMNHEGIISIKNEKDKQSLFAFFKFIDSLYPLLEKEDKNSNSNIVPHFGESHCLSFAHQNLSISTKSIKIQPVLITGGKAWHFANKENNQWKESLTQQIKNHSYSDKVFISFGEIDCRKDEGILNYANKNNKDMTKVCEKTVKGYINYMEKILCPYYSERYYFGVPAPTKQKDYFDDLDIKRIKLIKHYNSILKNEVLSRGFYFLDVYKLTSDDEGVNNNMHMCDDYHLSPKCLSILFENHLCKSLVSTK